MAIVNSSSAKPLAALVLRISLSIQIIGACLALLTPDSASPEPWLQLAVAQPVLLAIVVLLATACTALLIGLATQLSALVVGAILIVIETIHLASNPFYNVSEAIGILFAMDIAILLLSDSKLVFGVDDFRKIAPPAHPAWSEANVLIRCFIGATFVFQGLKNMSGAGGIVEFARRVYVAPYHGVLPDWLLWVSGITNPPWEFAGGCLLIAGLFTAEASIGMCVFLLVIVFGHVLQDKGAATVNMRDYALANLIAVLAVFLLEIKGNKWSLDALRFRRTGTQPDLKR